MNKISIDPPVPNPIRQQVTDILRSAIARCQFEPGGRLTERELCESLNVSRSTVRESLRQLESEGLVRITPNKGPMITSLSEDEARELYDIRTQLERYVVGICANRRDASLIATLKNALANMKAALKRKDFEELQVAKTEFYDHLFDGSGNRQLAVILKQLRARGTLVRGTHQLRDVRMEESVRGVSQILKAIVAGNAEAAAAASDEHLQRAADLALRAMDMAKSEQKGSIA